MNQNQNTTYLERKTFSNYNRFNRNCFEPKCLWTSNFSPKPDWNQPVAARRLAWTRRIRRRLLPQRFTKFCYLPEYFRLADAFFRISRIQILKLLMAFSQLQGESTFDEFTSTESSIEEQKEEMFNARASIEELGANLDKQVSDIYFIIFAIVIRDYLMMIFDLNCVKIYRMRKRPIFWLICNIYAEESRRRKVPMAECRNCFLFYTHARCCTAK